MSDRSAPSKVREFVELSQPINLYLAGLGHSGSTLLSFLLGGHSKIANLGEIGFLTAYGNRSSSENFCSCGTPVSDCDYWLDIVRCWSRNVGTPHSEILKTRLLADPDVFFLDESGFYRERTPDDGGSHSTILRDLVLLSRSKTGLNLAARYSPEINRFRDQLVHRNEIYDAAREAHRTPIVVDASKTPGYRLGSYLTCSDKARHLVLVRDGRGVCYSRMRRLGTTMEECVRWWLKEQNKHWLVNLAIPKSIVLTVRYEDLCAGTDKELARICKWLGIAFEPEMKEFRTDQHSVGGNPMRRRRDQTSISIDESWRETLTRDDLNCFDELAGKMNSRFGYSRE